ncbi:MAG: 50S ribosomal protein L22 [Clostridiales bacterium]|jgi:large subunit ribosomal protein L22|nr:50S ribosomal protein L22 [Clostridiales bacterium]
MAKKESIQEEAGMEVKEAKAMAKHVRISPRKARAVIDLIRGKELREAEAILKFTVHKGTKPIGKVLQSAAANAEHNYEMDRELLYVKAAYVDGGPVIKRMMPRAQGRGDIIKKRSSHITIIMGEK